MLKTKFSALCLLLLGTASISIAQGAMLPPTGLYFGLNAGQAEVRKSCDNITNCDNADTTLRVDLGYQINSNFAAELGYASFGTLFNASNSSVNAKQEAHAWTGSAIGLWPIVPQFDIFGRVGLARYDVTNTGTLQGVPVEDKASTKPYFGAGIKFDIDNNWLLRAEYQIYTDISGVDGTQDNVHAWYLGGAYRF